MQSLYQWGMEHMLKQRQESDLNHLAYRQIKLTRLLKQLDTVKKKIRAELFQEADEHFAEKHWLLPMTTWLVPWEFFERTGMSREDFVKTRFPQWNVESSREDPEGIVYVLKKKKEYMPWSYSDDEYEISRSVAEITPEIDWESMEKVEPEFFAMFAKPVQTYELDVAAFNQYMNKHPEFSGASFLTRYSTHKMPTLRVLSKVVKKDE